MAKVSTTNRTLGAVLLLIGVFLFFFWLNLFSIPIIVVGIALLAAGTRSTKKPMAQETPVGVTLVATLTLLASFAVGFLALVSWAVSFVGSAGISISITTLGWFHILTPALMGLVGFIASIAMLVGNSQKLLWFAMVAFWFSLFAYFIWWDYSVVWRFIGDWFSRNRQVYAWQYEEILVTFLPLVYSLGCIGYFQKSRVKKYFQMKQPPSSPNTS